jgi:hypothetical protein
MHSRRRIGGAGSTGDEADAGPTGGLALGFRHDRRPALLPADGDGDIAIVAGVESGDIALARHAEHLTHAMNDELIDQNFGGRPGAVIGAHCWSLRMNSHRYSKRCGIPSCPGLLACIPISPDGVGCRERAAQRTVNGSGRAGVDMARCRQNRRREILLLEFRHG